MPSHPASEPVAPFQPTSTEVHTSAPVASAPARPATAAVERYFGIKTWTTAPNPLSVWSAKIHGSYGDFAIRLEATGSTENDALDRLERIIVSIQDNAR